MSEYGDVHRHLLQFIMKAGYVEGEELKAQLTKLLREHSQSMRSDTIDTYIKAINASLAPMHMKIQTLALGGKRYHGLINELDDDISKLATTYSVDEMGLFKKILEAIVSEDEDAGASSRNSNAIDVNAVLELRDKMSLDDAKLTLANLIRDGWLAKRGQKITLGVRTLLDLRGYLEDVYGVDVLSNVSRYS